MVTNTAVYNVYIMHRPYACKVYAIGDMFCSYEVAYMRLFC